MSVTCVCRCWAQFCAAAVLGPAGTVAGVIHPVDPPVMCFWEPTGRGQKVTGTDLHRILSYVASEKPLRRTPKQRIVGVDPSARRIYRMYVCLRFYMAHN